MTKIKKVETYSFPMSSSWIVDTEIANPMSIYSEYKKVRSSWMSPMTTVIVKITTDDGNYGLGWAGGGKKITACVIDEVFKNLLIDKDPFDIEGHWDRMYRASIPYGRRGTVIEAISAIDTALWDVVGKIANLPVYKLLGGKTKDKIKIYATGNHTKRQIEMGFKDKKLSIPYGPADGIEGMKKNEELVKTTRELLGPDGNIMLDCYMGWDEEYTIQMARRLKDYNIRWIEEPLLPEHYDGYRRLREILNPMGIMITGGEHEFTHYGFKDLIEKGCVDIVQPDIGRAGGITAFKKICALASVHNMTVVPHGSGAPTYHAVINSTVSPFAEYIDIQAQGGALNFINEPQPKDGFIYLDDKPGFGYEINPELFNGVDPVPIW